MNGEKSNKNRTHFSPFPFRAVQARRLRSRYNDEEAAKVASGFWILYVGITRGACGERWIDRRALKIIFGGPRACFKILLRPVKIVSNPANSISDWPMVPPICPVLTDH